MYVYMNNVYVYEYLAGNKGRRLLTDTATFRFSETSRGKVCIYIYIYMCISIYIYMCVVCACVYIYIYIYICISIYIYGVNR